MIDETLIHDLADYASEVREAHDYEIEIALGVAIARMNETKSAPVTRDEAVAALTLMHRREGGLES